MRPWGSLRDPPSLSADRNERRVRLTASRFARTHQFRLFIHVSDGSEFKVVGMREIPQFRRDA